MKVSDAFQFLRDGLSTARETQMVTRAAEVSTDKGEVLLALDFNEAPHVLIPSDTELSRNLSGALHISSSNYVDQGVEKTWLDIWCSDARLAGVFERFTADVLDRLRAGGPPEGVVLQALDEWQTLLHGGLPGMSRSQAVGLVGELELLTMLAHTSPLGALDTWKGPENKAQDFVTETASIEVKTTEARDGGTIEIHGTAQLDPAEEPLHLLVFRVEEHPAGSSVEERVAKLVSLGVPGLALLKKLKAVGYQEPDPMGQLPFRVAAPMMWDVTPEFPGIRQSRFSVQERNAISGVKYSLSLAALPEPLTATEAATVISRFGVE